MNRDGPALATLTEAAAIAARLHGADSLALVPVCHAQAETYIYMYACTCTCLCPCVYI